MPRLPRRGKYCRAAVINDSNPSHNARFAMGQFVVSRKLGIVFRM